MEVREIDAAELTGPEQFFRDVVSGCRPVIIRGLVAGWPAVAAARQSAVALRDYLAGFDRGGTMDAFVGDPAIPGKYYYRDELDGFNFERRRRMTLGEALATIVANIDQPEAETVYIGLLPTADYLPGFSTENVMPVLPLAIGARIWLGHASNVSAHYDMLDNVACVIAGRRRFTLYPPDAIGSLYVDPIDNTMAGQPVSLAASSLRDDARYSRFAALRDQALVAELEAGDALYLPKLWWHQIEATAPVDGLVNYWWDAFSGGPDQPNTAMLLAMITIAERPLAERAAGTPFSTITCFVPMVIARASAAGAARPARTAQGKLRQDPRARDAPAAGLTSDVPIRRVFETQPQCYSYRPAGRWTSLTARATAHSMAGAFTRIPAEDAYRATVRQKAAKWPDRASGRLEPMAQPSVAPGFVLPPCSSVFTIGSCFARNIEIALRDHGLRVPTLDLRLPEAELMKGTGLRTGILNKYTPFSMLNEVEQLARDDDAGRFLIEVGDDAWWDGQLHSHEPVTRERALKRRRRIGRLYDEAIAESAVVIVTLGLIEAWWDEVEQLYLNDAVPRHVIDRYPGRFFFEVLPVEKTIDAVMRLVAALHARNPAQKMLLTVSPVPFQRSFSGQDAIAANSYSKSCLRVAAEVATRSFDHVDYFPSYETVTLSDHALSWEDDLVHVKPAMIDYNVARMIAAYMPAAGEMA